MIDNKLIKNALTLTGKTMEDIEEIKWWKFDESGYVFNYKTELSIEKFCYYLLSPEFIEKYYKNMYPNEEIYTYSNFFHWLTERFWIAIYEYQSWNEEPLIELLSKI